MSTTYIKIFVTIIIEIQYTTYNVAICDHITVNVFIYKSVLEQVLWVTR